MVKYLVEIGLQEVCRNHLVTSQQILKKKIWLIFLVAL